MTLLLPRRRFLLGAAAGICAPAVVRAQNIIGSGVFGSSVLAVPYVGPGDVATFSGWWGLRAYSAATIGTAAIRLFKSSDSYTTGHDVVTLSDGTLNVADAWFDGSTYHVGTLYDQTGGGKDLTQATDAVRPLFLLATLGAKPVISFTLASNMLLSNATGIGSSAQPWSQSFVWQINTDVAFRTLFGDSSHTNGIAIRGTADKVDLFASDGFAEVSALDGHFHRVNWVANAAATKYVIDGGSVQTVSAGTASWAVGAVGIGDLAGSATPAFYFSEAGDALFNLGTSLAALDANQLSFYGVLP